MNTELLEQFISIVGPSNVCLPSADLSRYTHEIRGIYHGKTPLVLKPGATAEISTIARLASKTGTKLVPQGGNTGHVCGAIPDESNTQIIVSLERMNNIREIDLEGNALVCDAGCILETIQKTAADNERLFPLSLGSQGSCQIGGNISSNAGGTAVLAYGNTRQLVLGLEVVLASGEIWNGLRRLKKDNTGYNLKDLFIGSEGTLGIITAAVLKLFPRPKGQAVAWCGLNRPDDALALLGKAQEICGSGLTAFELMGDMPVSFTFQHMSGIRNPLSNIFNWQVLVEVSSGRSQEDANETLQTILETALTDGLLEDAALSDSIAQQHNFWRIREFMPSAQKHEGASIKHDISIPVHLIPEFFEKAQAIIKAEMPDARPCIFGHMGDGNMHYNITQPKAANGQDFMARQEGISELIYALVVDMNGSVAAEHGVGRVKRKLISKVKEPIEMALMRSIKKGLDPDNILNPDKVI